MHTLFRYSIFFWNAEVLPYEFFRYCETNLGKKLWQTPSSLIKKNCETRKLLKHRSVSSKNFSALWNKKISTDNSEVPLISLSFFDSRFFPKHRRVALPIFLVLWDKSLEKKSWQTPSSPIKKKLRNKKFSETPKCFRTKFFGTVEQKNINR